LSQRPISRAACEVTFCNSCVIFWLRKRRFSTYERHPIASEGINVASSANIVIWLLRLWSPKRCGEGAWLIPGEHRAGPRGDQV
jgi:hypothetical protein